jgi:hypothetical protein
MMARRRTPRPVGHGRTLGFAALGVLAVATIALVWAASGRQAAVSGDVTAIPIPEFTPTGTATPAPPLVLAPRARLIVPVDADTAWRTSTLACVSGGEAAIELSIDRGATWTAHPLREVDAAAILAIDPIDSDVTVGVVSQSSDDCTVGYDISFTGGEFWRNEPDEVFDLPYAVPGESQVVAGTARYPVGCATPSDFAVRTGSEAAVLCDDAVLRLTADGAVTWQHPETEASVLAVTTIDRGYLIAQARHQDCTGIRLLVVRSSDGGQEPLACLAAFDETTPIALAVLGDDVWAWIGDQVGVSDDGGITWDAAWLQAAAQPGTTPTETATPGQGDD